MVPPSEVSPCSRSGDTSRTSFATPSPPSSESLSPTKSPFSLLSLRAKALQLVKAYDVNFKGTGAERTDCIANYFTRQKVHEVLAHIDRAKEEKVARAHETFDHTLLDGTEEDTCPRRSNSAIFCIGRVSKEIKTIMLTLEKAGVSTGEDDEDGEGKNHRHGRRPRAQLQSGRSASVGRLDRGTPSGQSLIECGDFSIVIGKNAVKDELSMFGASYASLMAERRNAAPGAESHPTETKPGPRPRHVTPDDEEEPERELSAMEKAMLEAEQHVLLEHQGKTRRILIT